MRCPFLLLFYYLYKDIQVSMLAVLSVSWSHSSLWSEEALMQWLGSCYCKIRQSKGEAVTFYCVQRPQGGNGQDLKETVTALTEYEVINKPTFQKYQKFQGTSWQYYKQTKGVVFPCTMTSVFTYVYLYIWFLDWGSTQQLQNVWQYNLYANFIYVNLTELENL